MTPPKFENGFRVTILPRVENKGGWQNSHIGSEAIIEFSSLDGRGNDIDTHDYDASKPCYSLLILLDNGRPYTLRWFEEDSLELMCKNAEKGKKLIAEYYSKAPKSFYSRA